MCNSVKGFKKLSKSVQMLLILSKNKKWEWALQFSSVTQSCSTPWPHGLQHTGLSCPSPTHEFTQTHVHWVGDAIQQSHPLSSRPPPAFNLSQHQGLSNESLLHIRWPKYWSFSFSIILPMNVQDWFTLGWTGWISMLSKGLSRVISNITVQKHQFFGAQLSL